MRVALAGCALALLAVSCRTPERRDEPRTFARFFLEQNAPQSVWVALPQSEVRVAVAPKPVFTEFDFADVEMVEAELGRCLAFRLTPAASHDLYRLTASSQGRRLVLMVNGTALGARRIEAPFAEGVVTIFVEVPDDALPALTRSLQRTTAELRRQARKR